jgi:hypothetical protein
VDYSEELASQWLFAHILRYRRHYSQSLRVLRHRDVVDHLVAACHGQWRIVIAELVGRCLMRFRPLVMSESRVDAESLRMQSMAESADNSRCKVRLGHKACAVHRHVWQ